MPATDKALAEWLKSPAKFETAASAQALSLWGEAARASTLITPLASSTAAAAEAARQLAQLAQPMVLEEVVLPGVHRTLEGRVIRVAHPDLAEDGQSVTGIVVAQSTDDMQQSTTLTLWRRL
jgi:hypothetical protein